MEEIIKREQVIFHMMENNIDIRCLQETNIPESRMERKATHTFIFSSDIQGDEEHNGVGCCFSHKMKKYRSHYIQHSSRLVEMEINNRGNNLVIFGAYIPHDDVHEPTRTNIWEKLNRTTNELSTNRSKYSAGRL